MTKSGQNNAILLLSACMANFGSHHIERSSEQKHIVLYDGECGICQKWINYIINRDEREVFNFCPLQQVGNISDLLSRYGDTIIVITNERSWLTRSDAVIFIAEQLENTPTFLLKLARFIPKTLRDLGYRAFAACRRMISRKPDGLCPVVPPNIRRRFLENLPEGYGA